MRSIVCGLKATEYHPNASGENLTFKVPSALARVGVVQLVGGSSWNQKVAGLIHGQGTHLGFGFDPQSGLVGEMTNPCFSFSLLFLSLSPFLSRFLSLKATEKVLGGG